MAIYEVLANKIRQAILSGQLKAGQRIGSEHQLARTEGISRLTVRRASELLIREGLIDRWPGRGLYVRAQPLGVETVQVVAGNLGWETALRVCRGVQAAARERGTRVQLYDAHGNMEADLTMLRQLPRTGVRGAVILGLHHPAFNEALCALHVQRFPFVLVDQRLHDIQVSSVTADNYGGGYAVGRYLLEQGHRRIAFVGDLAATSVRERLEGLRDAVGEAGLGFDRSLVANLEVGADRLGDWSPQVEQGTVQVIARRPAPTAIFASCDAVARAVYRALAKQGLRIPEDLSVVGFDDDPLAEWLTPPLTTVRQPFFEMGRVAMEILSEAVTQKTHEAVNRVLPTVLMPRASVAPASAAGAAVQGAGGLEECAYDELDGERGSSGSCLDGSARCDGDPGRSSHLRNQPGKPFVQR